MSSIKMAKLHEVLVRLTLKWERLYKTIVMLYKLARGKQHPHLISAGSCQECYLSAVSSSCGANSYLYYCVSTVSRNSCQKQTESYNCHKTQPCWVASHSVIVCVFLCLFQTIACLCVFVQTLIMCCTSSPFFTDCHKISCNQQIFLSCLSLID